MLRQALFVSIVLILIACGGRESPQEPAGAARSPGATAEATPQATPETLLREDFNDPASGWTRTVPGQPRSIDYRDGAYIVAIDNDASSHVVATGNNPTEFDDVRVEVDVRKISGDPGAGMGIRCRDTNAGRYFADIDEEGEIRIGIYAREQEVLAGAEKPGVWKRGEVNRLRFDCNGDKLDFYVNGELQLSATDSRLPIGRIGLSAGGAGRGKTEVAFDNVVVMRP
jgi:hypothetical protein